MLYIVICNMYKYLQIKLTFHFNPHCYIFSPPENLRCHVLQTRRTTHKGRVCQLCGWQHYSDWKHQALCTTSDINIRHVEFLCSRLKDPSFLWYWLTATRNMGKSAVGTAFFSRRNFFTLICFSNIFFLLCACVSVQLDGLNWIGLFRDTLQCIRKSMSLSAVTKYKYWSPVASSAQGHCSPNLFKNSYRPVSTKTYI